jgi:uncharacterized surface protein with fasciclin (FAS1) repeats
VVHIIDSVLIPPGFVPPQAELAATTKNIVELAAGTHDLSTLVFALKRAQLIETLSGKGPFTVFAPTNEAFEKLPGWVRFYLLEPQNAAKLKEVLTYHVYAGEAKSTDLKDGEEVKTVEGESVKVAIEGSSVKINNAHVTAANVLASNGVVHIIDEVLIPPSLIPHPHPTKNIVELAAGTPDLSTLVTALKAAKLTTALSGKGPFTVFAPTNEAFAKVDKNLLAALLKPENVKKLTEVLTYHVVAAEAKSTDLKNGESIKTLEGESVKVAIEGSNVKINNADVTTANVLASNGVVHVIDNVLIPPGFVPPVDAGETSIMI